MVHPLLAFMQRTAETFTIRRSSSELTYEEAQLIGGFRFFHGLISKTQSLTLLFSITNIHYSMFY